MKKNTPPSMLLVIVIVCSVNLGFSQSQPDDLVKKFFTEFSKDGSDKALDNFYNTNPWITKAGVSIETLKVKMRELTKDFVGDFHGYELIGRKELGQSYRIVSYLAKYDRQPLRFTFQFYKPQDKWMVYSFEYDGNMSAEMEESLKLNYLTFGTEKVESKD